MIRKIAWLVFTVSVTLYAAWGVSLALGVGMPSKAVWAILGVLVGIVVTTDAALALMEGQNNE